MKKNYWMESLKEYNKSSSAYCVPKKNSQGYKEIMKIKQDMIEKDNRNKFNKKEVKKGKRKLVIVDE